MRCPKCEWVEWNGPTYVPDCWLDGYEDRSAVLARREHLRYICAKCGYVVEKPCADAKEGVPA